MDLRIGVSGGIFLVFALLGFASPPDRPGPDKEKNAVKTLFDGIPADLRAKVRDNPVRCDRVNDWLQDNVNGKGKMIEVRVELKEILPYRRDAGYVVYLGVGETKLNLLDADWHVVLSDRKLSTAKSVAFSSLNANFLFEGVNTVDAEKLADLKRAVIMGKVKEAKLSRINSSTEPTLNIILEDVVVDGNKWTPFKGPGGAGGFADNPFGGGAKGKGKGGATKKEPPP
jgi:hypothetical protein